MKVNWNLRVLQCITRIHVHRGEGAIPPSLKVRFFTAPLGNFQKVEFLNVKKLKS